MDKVRVVQLLRTVERHARSTAEAAAALAAEITDVPYQLQGVAIHPDDAIVEVTEEDQEPTLLGMEADVPKRSSNQATGQDAGGDLRRDAAHPKKGRKGQ